MKVSHVRDSLIGAHLLARWAGPCTQVPPAAECGPCVVPAMRMVSRSGSWHASYVDGLWDGRQVRDRIPGVVDDVVAEFDPVRVIVFGSVARGDDRDASDLDLLVLFDDVVPRERPRQMGHIRGAIGAPIPIDVLVGQHLGVRGPQALNGSPYYRPARERRVVHERSPA